MVSRLVRGQKLCEFDSRRTDFFGEQKYLPKKYDILLYNSMDETHDIKKLIEDNLTIPQIAVMINKSESAAKRLLKKLGLKTKRYCDHRPDAKTRVCRCCGVEKSLKQFPEAGMSPNGDAYRRWKCGACYSKKKADRIRCISAYVKDIKKNMQCSVCKNNDFRVLEFHHYGDDKEFNVADGIRHGFSKERILAEINKCEVLCANCHRILHYENKQGVVRK